MAMMLIALLAVVLPALQTETAQTATMQSDVDRLVRAAEGLEETHLLIHNANADGGEIHVTSGRNRYLGATTGIRERGGNAFLTDATRNSVVLNSIDDRFVEERAHRGRPGFRLSIRTARRPSPDDLTQSAGE